MKITLEWEYVLDGTGREARELAPRANGTRQPEITGEAKEAASTQDSVWFFVEPREATG